MSATRSGKVTSPAHLEHMPSVDRMREFLAVMQTGSISEAARTIGLPRATLSRRMAGFEADLGVRLILRRTTKLALTHAGEELLRRAQRIVSDADEAWNAVRRLDDTPRGLLRVSMAGPHFLKLFTDFLCDFPEVGLLLQPPCRSAFVSHRQMSIWRTKRSSILGRMSLSRLPTKTGRTGRCSSAIPNTTSSRFTPIFIQVKRLPSHQVRIC